MVNKKQLLAQLNKEHQEIYTFDEIFKFSKNKNRNIVKNMVSELVKEKRLLRLKKGLYLYVPEGYENNWTANNFWIGANIVQPYAISFWSALNYWGLTEQLPNKTYIQTTKSMVGYNKKILNNEYKFIKLSRAKFFGLTKIWADNHQIIITDKEKTLVDCLTYPQHGGGIIEAVKGLYQFYQNDKPKNIINYAKRMGQTSLKRLGYLLELLEVSNNEELNKIKKLIINPNSALLEPLIADKQSVWDSKWKLKINIKEQDLLSWKAK